MPSSVTARLMEEVHEKLVTQKATPFWELPIPSGDSPDPYQVFKYVVKFNLYTNTLKLTHNEKSVYTLQYLGDLSLIGKKELTVPRPFTSLCFAFVLYWQELMLASPTSLMFMHSVLVKEIRLIISLLDHKSIGYSSIDILSRDKFHISFIDDDLYEWAFCLASVKWWCLILSNSD